MSESPRHLARIVVLQALYAVGHSESVPESAFKLIAAEEKLPEKNIPFAESLFAEVLKKEEWADNNIAELAENWHLERIAAIDKIIMRMAMVELEVFVDVPYKVVINEALELAKEFSTAESSRFINGILDRFVKNHLPTTGENR